MLCPLNDRCCRHIFHYSGLRALCKAGPNKRPDQCCNAFARGGNSQRTAFPASLLLIVIPSAAC